MAFLSTLSLRRATDLIAKELALAKISIHALLAESDGKLPVWLLFKMTFLSTLSLRRATNVVDTSICVLGISIHALLAESDPHWVR